MPTAAIVIADGYTDAEFLVSLHMLKAERFDATVYSLNGGSVTGVMGWAHKHDTRKIDLRAQYTDWAPVDILVLIGGVKAIEKLLLSVELSRWIREQDADRRIIASICHGGLLLVNAGIAGGRRILSYYSNRVFVENAGAIWPEGEEVCVDGNIISCTHYDFSGIWMKEVLRVWRERGAQ